MNVRKNGSNLYVSPDEVLEALREATGLDADAGITHNGTMDGYMAALSIFADSSPRACDDLVSFVEAQDLQSYTIKVHAIKSMLRLIGAADLGEMAQTLENAGKEGRISYIDENHAGFVIDVRKLTDEIKSVLDIETYHDEDVIESSDKPLIDAFILEEAYSEMYKAAQDYDIDMLEELIHLVEDYSIPDTEIKLYEQVKAACDEFEYGMIVGLLEEKIN